MNDLITPQQLSARWLGSPTPATLATWRCRKTGPEYVKIGGKVMYRLADVKKYEARKP